MRFMNPVIIGQTSKIQQTQELIEFSVQHLRELGEIPNIKPELFRDLGNRNFCFVAQFPLGHLTIV